MYRIIFILSFVNGHLSYFHVSAIVNTVAMNIGLHVSFLNYSFIQELGGFDLGWRVKAWDEVGGYRIYFVVWPDRTW